MAMVRADGRFIGGSGALDVSLEGTSGSTSGGSAGEPAQQQSDQQVAWLEVAGYLHDAAVILGSEGPSAARRAEGPGAGTQLVCHGLARLHHQASQTPFDEQLRDLVTLAEQALTGVPRPGTSESELMVCPWFRIGDEVVRTIGMVARFDPVAEVTLDELRIELTYPQDAAAERFFRDHAHTGST